MSLAPLLAEPILVQVHTLAALAALLLGAVQLASPMRTGKAVHRALGYAWAALMLVVTLSSFGFVYRPLLGPFSWIHGLSAFTTVMVILGVLAARRRMIVHHRTTMWMIYVFALVVTGAFTLLPGRLMHRVVFG
ncbi:DUF2306 domain-containing protein [Salinarimonas sp.]|uniref:DUF2306 domain-containing protein n=1 Tax=Salinarimonas sp. TaxID=2766526 RepID=UPI0039194C40